MPEIRPEDTKRRLDHLAPLGRVQQLLLAVQHPHGPLAAVLIGAFIISTVLVPAVMHLSGRAN